MSEKNVTGPLPTETLLGGIEVVVSLRGKDRKAPSTTETVFLRQLSVEEYPKLLAVQGEEPRIIELYCDKPEGWANGLTPASYKELVTQGDRINDDFFQYVERRLARQEKLMPGINAKMRDAALAASQPSLLKSLSKPG
jgi:hypothetical protein